MRAEKTHSWLEIISGIITGIWDSSLKLKIISGLTELKTTLQVEEKALKAKLLSLTFTVALLTSAMIVTWLMLFVFCVFSLHVVFSLSWFVAFWTVGFINFLVMGFVIHGCVRKHSFFNQGESYEKEILETQK